ncbi:hypothetical protein L1987_69875 [Smallanthus sonchifolius]|uniref:Uncharacterized protein n=1 Tax=Smallanthus sonchifolius TaxID=185202 RepID=A0ACB9B6S8_9ASTR|nr:hypothetical protein L1987_69875 [Smallanthus sonchifolius]
MARDKPSGLMVKGHVLKRGEICNTARNEPMAYMDGSVFIKNPKVLIFANHSGGFLGVLIKFGSLSTLQWR